MLASAPTLPPLVCTLQSVESRWSSQPVEGIRQLEQQSFEVIRGPQGSVKPRAVIESRLTTLMQNFSSSGLDQNNPERTTYQWSFEAPLGDMGFNQQTETGTGDAAVFVNGRLIISNASHFNLKQQSRLIRSGSNKTLATLNEVASGVCAEQQ